MSTRLQDPFGLYKNVNKELEMGLGLGFVTGPDTRGPYGP